MHDHAGAPVCATQMRVGHIGVDADATALDAQRRFQVEGDVVSVRWLPDQSGLALRHSDLRNLPVWVHEGKQFDSPPKRMDTVDGLLAEYAGADRKLWHNPISLEFYPSADNLRPVLYTYWGSLKESSVQGLRVRAQMPFVRDPGAFVSFAGFVPSAFVQPVDYVYDQVTSPDQTAVAYSEFSDPSHSVLYVRERGGAARALTDLATDAHEPVWSPDGSKLAFLGVQNGLQRIMVIGRDGSGLKTIDALPHETCTHPSWHPKGTQIAAECKPVVSSYLTWPYLDLRGWWTSIYLFSADGSAPPRKLVDCGDNPYASLGGADLHGAEGMRCGAHNPQFRPVPELEHSHSGLQ